LQAERTVVHPSEGVGKSLVLVASGVVEKVGLLLIVGNSLFVAAGIAQVGLLDAAFFSSCFVNLFVSVKTGERFPSWLPGLCLASGGS
jgi:hypothetical protein